MSNSISLIAQYLDPIKQKELAIKLSQNLHENDNLATLCDLLDFLNDEVKSSIYPNVLNHSIKVLFLKDEGNESNDPDTENVLKMVSKLPNLSTDLIKYISVHLDLFIQKSKLDFIPSFPQFIQSCTKNFTSTAETLVNSDSSPFNFIELLLNFAERLYMVHTPADESINIDSTLLFCLGSNDETISSTASKIIRWRIKCIISEYKESDLVWNIIYNLQESNVKHHKTNSFVLWLRYLNNPFIITTKQFSGNVLLNKYWFFLQNGLISDYHEHRKFALSILKLTVQNINVNINTNLMMWDTTKSQEYLKEWKRYTTLFEILGIDTSLHQSQAASHDIIKLMSPKSLVHPSWGFCLLSTGFKASMESIRKFSLNLLLSIPKENLFLFKDGLNFFENIYLPNAMLASNFVVRQEESTNETHCKYGELLSTYIQNMAVGFKTDLDLSNLVDTVLKVLVNLKKSFDPARIYVTLGLLRGLKGKEILNVGHLSLLNQLFEVDAEGELFETTIQTINLRFLLHIDFKEVGLNGLLNHLGNFIKFNGIELVVKNIDMFIDFLIKNIKKEDLVVFIQNEFKKLDMNSKVLVIGLSIEMNLDVQLVDLVSSVFDSDELLVELYLSGFQIVDIINDPQFAVLYQKIVSDLCNNAENSSSSSILYKKCSSPKFINDEILFKNDFWESLNCTGLWKSINKDVQSPDETIIKSGLYKLRFFNTIMKAIVYSNDNLIDVLKEDNLFAFNQVLLKLPGNNLSKDFYKTKDELYGQFYELIRHCLEINDISDAFIEKLIKIIYSTMDITSYYLSYSSAVRLLANILTKYSHINYSQVEKIVGILIKIWFDLITERLILSQKDLHLSIIKTLYDPVVLSHSVVSETISSNLKDFGISVVESSAGRRSLLPTLTKQISEFQISREDDFEKSLWLSEVLVRAFMLAQLKNNIFRLETIIGKLYDDQINFVGNIYNETYGLDEISARANVLCILGSIKTSDFAWSIFEFINSSEEEFHLYTVIRLTDGVEEAKRIQLYTMILIILGKIDDRLIFPDIIKKFIDCLHTDPSPLVRVYIEWIISLNLLKSSKLTDFIFDDLFGLLGNGNTPNTIASYERILYLMIQHLPVEMETKLLSKLLTIIIPASTSNKAITRHFSLSLICAIYPQIVRKGLRIDETLLSIVANMYDTATTTDAFDQYRSGDALLWDIKNDFTLVCITGGVLLRLSDKNVDFITSETFKRNLSKEQIEFMGIPIGENQQGLWIKERKNQYLLQLQKKLEKTGQSEQSVLQTKSGAWSSIMDIDVQQQRGSEVKRSDLIVVSSLVDKAPNLGGICRLCDVLGAGLLTIHDIKIKNHQQFKTVAVTADQWMPIMELKPENIIEFFKEKKREGYTLIGLEQTDKSIVLDNELKFPKKSLILLGKEKEGISGDLLAELDFCVEIKQVGVIRSMNIQTATAVIVHAYSSQHC